MSEYTEVEQPINPNAVFASWSAHRRTWRGTATSHALLEFTLGTHLLTSAKRFKDFFDRLPTLPTRTKKTQLCATLFRFAEISRHFASTVPAPSDIR